MADFIEINRRLRGGNLHPEFAMSPEDEAKIAAWVKDAAGNLPDGEFEDTGSLMDFRIPGWDLR